MKKPIYILAILALIFSTSGCALIGDAFKGGIFVGLFIAIIIGILIWVLHSFSSKNLSK